MSRRLGRWLPLWIFGFTFTLVAQTESAPPALRASHGSIAGRVTDRHGVAQAGASVTILRQDGSVAQKAYTEPDGRFRFSSLLPGVYAAEVAQSSFLPFRKSSIVVAPAAEALLNIDLLSLADSLEIGIPADARASRDAWKWVLRAGYPNRPVLRWQPTAIPPYAGVARDPRERALRGTVQLWAGNESHGFGQDPGLRTSFDMAYAPQSPQWLGLAGSAGWESNTPAASLRATWNRRFERNGNSTLSLTVRQLFLPVEYWAREASLLDAPGTRLQSFTGGYEENKQLGDAVRLQYGSLFDKLSFSGTATRWSPFARLTYNRDSQTRLTIAYTAAGPRVLPFDWDPERHRSEQWLAIPQMSAAPDRRLALEGGTHIEAAWEQPLGDFLRFQAAAFQDRLNDTALSLAGDDPALSGELLRDPFSDRLFLSAPRMSAPGMRAALGTRLESDTEITLAYGYSGVIEAESPELAAGNAGELRSKLQNRRNHSIAVKVNSLVPWSATRVIASYRWLPGTVAAIPDPYDRSWSQADPYLNLFVLQPIPSPGVLPGHFEAVADMNNLLAQGYVTVVSANGARSYLFPVARSFRGGVNFIF
jgi:hypothetical protein